MSITEEVASNNCTCCLDHRIKNGEYIDIKWRDETNKGVWPRPYQESGIDLGKAKAIVVGQDPTIEACRPIECVLEANKEKSKLGRFVREVFSGLEHIISFDEIYFTNLVKCRFKEKPGKDKRNISEFLDCLAAKCYSRFLDHEIAHCRNARYLFTLGRDSFGLLAKRLGICHPPLSKFNEFYCTKFPLPTDRGRDLYLVPLPHQPTYDLARRYFPYSPEQVRNRLSKL